MKSFDLNCRRGNFLISTDNICSSTWMQFYWKIFWKWNERRKKNPILFSLSLSLFSSSSFFCDCASFVCFPPSFVLSFRWMNINTIQSVEIFCFTPSEYIFSPPLKNSKKNSDGKNRFYFFKVNFIFYNCCDLPSADGRWRKIFVISSFLCVFIRSKNISMFIFNFHLVLWAYLINSEFRWIFFSAFLNSSLYLLTRNS